MKLFIGKFDPLQDLTRVLDWAPQVPALAGVEVDLKTALSWNKTTCNRVKKVLCSSDLKMVPRFSLRTVPDPETLQDWISIWNDSWHERTPWVKVSAGRKQWDPGIGTGLRELRISSSNAPWIFEWGQDDQARSVQQALNTQLFQGHAPDLDWHSIPKSNANVCLHGWHEARWIRRYGPVQIESLVRKARRARVQALTLSYSGRWDELKAFSATT